jgi:hypothetical protein
MTIAGAPLCAIVRSGGSEATKVPGADDMALAQDEHGVTNARNEHGVTKSNTSPRRVDLTHTQRQQRYRQRQRKKLVPIVVNIFEREVQDLVAHGLLSSAHGENRAEIGRVLEKLIGRAFAALRSGKLP